MLGLSRGRSRRACLVAADQLAADDDAALGEADANCQRAGESRMRQRRLPSPPVGPKTVISAASSTSARLQHRPAVAKFVYCRAQGVGAWVASCSSDRSQSTTRIKPREGDESCNGALTDSDG